MTRVLGITGAIGTGKSTAAAFFRDHGCPVFDADRCVHALLGAGGAAYARVARAFPTTRHVSKRGGEIDRCRLGALVWRDPVALRRLEKILHPLVRQEAERFLARAREANAPLVILDIPLLFEGRYHRLCDAVLCLTTTPNVQRRRVMRRGRGMTLQKAHAILHRQHRMDARRRQRADRVIDTTTGGLSALQHTLHKVLAQLRDAEKPF